MCLDLPCTKMIAVIDDPNPPFPMTHASWKGHDDQKQLSVVIKLLSGVDHAGIQPSVSRDGKSISIEVDHSIAQFVPVKFLQALRASGNTTMDLPHNTMTLANYPFHMVPLVSNLVDCLDTLKQKSTRIDHNGRWCIMTTFKFASPCILNPVPIGNSFQLISIEGDQVTTKDKGYWSQVLLLECEGECNTFWKPVGPPQFDVIHCVAGGWATQIDMKMLGASFHSSSSSMDTSSSLGASTNNKWSWTSFVPHNEDYQCLFIENAQLC